MPRPDPLVPHPGRLSPEHPRRAEIMVRHTAAVTARQPGYIDPDSGLFVMTAVVHLERGRCCERGCRHCPYVEDD